MIGSTGEHLAGKYFPAADIKSFDDMMDAVTALPAGQVDAVLSGYPTVHSVIRLSLESPAELLNPLEHPGIDEISRTLTNGIAENFSIDKTPGKTVKTLSMEIKNKIC